MKKFWKIGFVLLLVAALFTGPAMAAVQIQEDGTVLGEARKVNFSTGVTATMTGGVATVVAAPTEASYAGVLLDGANYTAVAKTASYSTTAADAGKLITNEGASAEITIDLPEASTVVGDVYSIGLTGAYTVNVNPDDADQILGETNAAGDAIQSVTAGSVVVLRAADDTNWLVEGIYADASAWSDVN